MDRSVIAPYKAEERELSEKLYKKLMGLTLLYPPTEEFRKCVSVDMFLKPNQTAFFHVMHYLFRILDPAEFKRRFYWPITDKRAEANFRSSTVEYVKHLSDKHGLNINIKTHLVVMPGGMKFIVFILQFASFVIQELIKEREKVLGHEPDYKQLVELNVPRMKSHNEYLKAFAVEYITQADMQIKKLRETIQRIWSNLERLAEGSGMTAKQLVDDEFLSQFEEYNAKSYADKYSKPRAKLELVEKLVRMLKESVEKFHSKQQDLKMDKEGVVKAVKKILENLLQAGEISGLPVDMENSCDFNVLLTTFNCIYPRLIQALEAANEMPTGSSQFVTQELDDLVKDLLDIESQLMEYQKLLNANIVRRANERKEQQQNEQQVTPKRDQYAQLEVAAGIDGRNIEQFSMKLVATPPIKMEMLETVRNTNVRLPLLGDFTSAKGMGALAANAQVHIPAILSSARKNRTMMNHSMDLHNVTINKPHRIDAKQLLRTISKAGYNNPNKSFKDMESHTLSILDNKRTEQNLLGQDLNVRPADLEAFRTPIKYNASLCDLAAQAGANGGGSFIVSTLSTTATTTLIQTTPITPFNPNEGARIAGMGPLMENTPLLHTNRRLSAVKKVQGASMSLHNLSTSPSGRLHALVDMTMTSNINDEDLWSKKTNDDLRLTPIPLLRIANDENNPNLINTGEQSKAGQREIFKANMQNAQDEDDICNISDSVLKDVIM